MRIFYNHQRLKFKIKCKIFYNRPLYVITELNDSTIDRITSFLLSQRFIGKKFNHYFCLKNVYSKVIYNL